MNTKISQTGVGLATKDVKFTYDSTTGLNTRVERYVNGLLKVETTNAEDLYGRLTGIEHRDGANVIIGKSSYIIDNLDRLQTEIKDGQSRTIGYDRIDQVKTVTGSNSEAYTYDLNGNRINAGYATGADNRLRSDGSYTYLYDREGNRTQRTEMATGIVDNYTWDDRNRLESIVTVASGGAVLGTVVYEYDANDQRVKKTVTSALPTGGVVENYFIDRNQIAVVTDGGGVETFHYLYGLNVDQVLAQDSPAGMVWALADRLGSIDTLTDKDGVVVDKRNFDSFGRVISETNPSVSFRYGYTSRERDLESGLSYYRARYYDPNVGRFISVDPLGFGAGDTNLYRYVGNSSTLATDPTGMFSLQELWNNGVNTAQNIWNGGVNNVQKAVNKVQQSVNNAGQAVVNGSVSFRNTVTSNAQAGLEYWTGVAVAGQNEGGIIGGAKQFVGTTFGLLSSLATEDNIDRTNETLASVFGGSLLSGGARAIAGLQQTKNIATAIAATRVAKAVTPLVTAVAPWVDGTAKSVAAFTGGYQGGTQLRQAWTGEGENGRQLSNPERVIAAINGVATIGASLLGLKGSTPRNSGNIGVNSNNPLGGRGPNPIDPSDSKFRFGSHLGNSSGRPFYPQETGLPISARQLSNNGVRITNRGVDKVEQHLSRFGSDTQNQKQLGRLRQIASGKLEPTSSDFNNYTHELRESLRYKKLGYVTGVPEDPEAALRLWNNAHTATLEEFGLREGVGVLYHPSTYPKY